MPIPIDTTSLISPSDMTGDQLAASSERVAATTRYGPVVGGRVKNGCQVFLNVPYGVDVPRWTDPAPLPSDYSYEGKEYITDGLYCAQPTRYYTLTVPVRDRLGLGSPTENPFFADIYAPSYVSPGHPLLPVKVFIHGGFMQFGSTSGQNYNQQFFAAEQFGEIRVLLGHRLSVLGFLGAAQPDISGNYGFKDCWLGLEWVRDNIEAFGGDPNQVHLSGLSGGGHIVGQLLHHAGRMAPAKAPFCTALLQSNAVISDPVQPAERDCQVQDLCENLGIDCNAPDLLEQLRDTSKITTEQLMKAVQGDGDAATYRGVAGPDGWVRNDMMAYQQSGRLASDLKRAGVRCVITGDVRDERAFYRFCHPCDSAADVKPHLDRFYPSDISEKLLAAYPALQPDASRQECDDLLGRIFADAQVHLPVRLLVKDLADHGFPTVRYAIEMVAEALGSKGVVTHGSDLVIQHYRLSKLSSTEAKASLAWNAALNEAIYPALSGGEFEQRKEEEMLILSSSGETYWDKDWRWPELRAAERALRG